MWGAGTGYLINRKSDCGSAVHSAVTSCKQASEEMRGNVAGQRASNASRRRSSAVVVSVSVSLTSVGRRGREKARLLTVAGQQSMICGERERDRASARLPRIPARETSRSSRNISETSS